MDAYVEGFVEKCAAAGVNPKQLVKRAKGLGFLGSIGRLFSRPTAAVAGALGKKELAETIRRGAGMADEFKINKDVARALGELQGKTPIQDTLVGASRYLDDGVSKISLRTFPGSKLPEKIVRTARQEVEWSQLPKILRRKLMTEGLMTGGAAHTFKPGTLAAKNVDEIRQALKVPGIVGGTTLGAAGVGATGMALGRNQEKDKRFRMLESLIA